jgi:mannose-1-phosphate guanylyltransferase/mannose-6-phosphate isomerase
MIEIIPVILSGGSGTRLWPLSRVGYPKQFLILSGNKSLFQQAVERVNQIECEDITVGNTLVVTSEEHRFLAIEQLREIQNVNPKMILEPVGRNTAPALTLAALCTLENEGDPILVVSPSDQIIQNDLDFKNALQQSIRKAEEGGIVLLGVTPHKPETGYGYIQKALQVGKHGDYAVNQFIEKPSVTSAKFYFESGRYLWNSGIFVLHASTWLKALQHFRPDIADAAQLSWQTKIDDSPFVRPNKEAFIRVPSDSIDYAVMEKCPNSKFAINIVPLNAGWNDLGSWDAVYQLGKEFLNDAKGNLVHGDALMVDTSDSLIHASSRLVGTLGVKNLIVIETSDAVLVADRNQSQNVKKLVKQLEEKNRRELSLHRKVHRPWGWYDCIDEAENFKVKRIKVNPGASLSLQKHLHRAEHWIVVKGTAEITTGKKVFILTENQSTYIPLGEVHRLSNPCSLPLEIIEVQSGTYLGEDDIIRFEDNYGRTA